MSSGYERNAELSRAAILAVAGGAVIGLSRNAPDLAAGSAGMVVLVLGGGMIVVAIVLAVRSLFRRSGGADR